MVDEPTTPGTRGGVETTRDFRLLRKAIKELFANRPDGIDRDQLAKLAEAKGIAGDDFKNVLQSLTNSGHLYYDESLQRFRYVRNE